MKIKILKTKSEVKNMKNKILFFGILFIVGFIISSTFISAQNTDSDRFYGCPMFGYNASYGTSYMFLNWIIYALVIVLIVAGIYWIIKSANKR